MCFRDRWSVVMCCVCVKELHVLVQVGGVLGEPQTLSTKFCSKVLLASPPFLKEWHVFVCHLRNHLWLWVKKNLLIIHFYLIIYLLFFVSQRLTNKAHHVYCGVVSVSQVDVSSAKAQKGLQHCFIFNFKIFIAFTWQILLSN